MQACSPWRVRKKVYVFLQIGQRCLFAAESAAKFAFHFISRFGGVVAIRTHSSSTDWASTCCLLREVVVDGLDWMLTLDGSDLCPVREGQQASGHLGDHRR